MDSSKEFKIGDRVYIVANNISVKELEIISMQDGYCTLRDLERYGAIRLRKSRLYNTREAACQALSQRTNNNDRGFIRPY